MRSDLSRKIWFSTIFIIGMGLAALYSASYQNVRVPPQIFYDQLLCAFVGVLIAYFLGRVDYRKFYDAAYVFYGINVVLLLVVLVSGRHAMGARRWMEIGGFSFQPSELTKLSLIFMLGRYYSHRRPALSFSLLTKAQVIGREIIFPFFLTVILMLLIFKQPDLGTALLLFGMFVVMLFASGTDFRYIVGFLGLCLCLVPFGWHYLRPYQKDRLLVFLNPNIDPLGAGYTIIQSKIAIGSGRIFGKGWLSGTQNQLNFLPERHTDFIFSVIGEEWGLLGALLLIYFYFMLVRCGLTIADQVKDKFGMLVTIGIVSILTLQVIINIGMVMGLFPIVGLTLPFISYGRTSLLIFMIMVGFLLNLSKKRSAF
ncbi:MAG TPA: rod shape-determining protein RodA [Candidatus Omnitrophica bacterium]|nr:MAG: rod shape-determining protein RodA [Omnitrophica WOR_2 bacterium GWA2_45_18]HBR14595.1 rod shape-determining protein RodA [Candidatus Omnitrophota bacterium]